MNESALSLQPSTIVTSNSYERVSGTPASGFHTSILTLNVVYGLKAFVLASTISVFPASRFEAVLWVRKGFAVETQA